MKNINQLNEALSKCKDAYKKNPLFYPFASIIRQLEYLIDVEEGKTKDFALLKKIKIGWIAARELDGYEDQKLINMLCTISKEAEEMAVKMSRSYESKYSI